MGLIAYFRRLITRRVHCLNCPNFRAIKKEGDVIVGACLKEKSVITNFPRIARAFAVRYDNESCEHHPLWKTTTGFVATGITFSPKQFGQDNAGFSRAPNLAEAVKLAGNLPQCGSQIFWHVEKAGNSADNGAVIVKPIGADNGATCETSREP